MKHTQRQQITKTRNQMRQSQQPSRYTHILPKTKCHSMALWRHDQWQDYDHDFTGIAQADKAIHLSLDMNIINILSLWDCCYQYSRQKQQYTRSNSINTEWILHAEKGFTKNLLGDVCYVTKALTMSVYISFKRQTTHVAMFPLIFKVCACTNFHVCNILPALIYN